MNEQEAQDRITALEGEIVRLGKLLESEAESWERDARDADDGETMDYYQNRAEEIRDEIKRTDEGREIMARVNDAEKFISRAQWQQERAEGDLRLYRQQMEELERFAGWLKAEFGGVFDLKRILEAKP